MKQTLALLLLIIGFSNVAIGSSGVDVCCGSNGSGDEIGLVAHADEPSGPACDCSTSPCTTCGILGHCELALLSTSGHSLELRPQILNAHAQFFYLNLEPASILDPPKA